MRHAPMIAPNGRLQILASVCQVSGSCHISAIAPNSTADPPKTIRPRHAVFIEKSRPLQARWLERRHSRLLLLRWDSAAETGAELRSGPTVRRFILHIGNSVAPNTDMPNKKRVRTILVT